MLLGPGCTSKTEPKSAAPDQQAQPPQPLTRLGARPELSFDFKAVTEVSLSKANPMDGDRWNTRIVKIDDPFLPHQPGWFIQSSPGEIQDRRAHGTLIMHMLDLIRTLQVAEAPFSGTPESFGLQPPWYDLHWQTPGAPHEIQLGMPAKDADGSFAGLYGKIVQPPVAATFTMNGSLLKMLELLTQFNALRLPTLTTFDADDVDEITIYSGNATQGRKPQLYAQRENGAWTDLYHHPLKRGISDFLHGFTHLRIEKFVDDPQQTATLNTQAMSKPLYTLRFEGRALKPILVQLAQQKQTWATITSRPAEARTNPAPLAVFGVYPQALSMIAVVLRN